ncbi:MAG TPA: hypothetical protein VNO81_10645 [Candidatus Nitrosotenuis sp.]|jgi:hypothetical protein|nr:hypothetical protein [Candidatus Nitrosotenuis sp.]
MAILKQLDGKAFFQIPDEELGKYAIPENKLSQVLKQAGARLGSPASREETQGKKVISPAERGELVGSGAEARASYLYETQVICPYCGSVRSIVASSEVYQYYECGNCGNVYKA